MKMMPRIHLVHEIALGFFAQRASFGLAGWYGSCGILRNVCVTYNNLKT